MAKEKECALLCKGCGNRTVLVTEDVLVIMALKETCPESKSKCPKCGAEMGLEVASGDGETSAETAEEPALQEIQPEASSTQPMPFRDFDPFEGDGKLYDDAAARNAPPGTLPVRLRR